MAKAEVVVAQVMRNITDMGFKVAANKTEAMFFRGKASEKPPRTHIRVSQTRVLVGDRLKYLGLLLDGEWRFELHFEVLAPRVGRFAAALDRILPNLGGTDRRVR